MPTERSALLLSTAVALLVGVVALAFAVLSGSRAVLLDGLFNLTYVVIGLFTVRVAELVTRPDTPEFPFGHAYFESLVNAGKGMLILGISVTALIDSVVALAGGGREIEAGPAIAYALFATVVCTATALRLHRVRRRVESPLVEADAANWVLNAIISTTVLAAFCLVPILHRLGYPAAAAYVDPLLVGAVVTICLGVPIRMAWRATMELLNRAPPESVRAPIRAAVEEALDGLPVRRLHLRMVRPGRTLYMVVHAVLPPDFEIDGLPDLDALRARVDGAVRKVHARVVIDAMFTADERWAEPTAGDR